MFNVGCCYVDLYKSETWSPTATEEHRLKLSENRVLRRIFGTKRENGRRVGEHCIMRSFIACTLHKALFRWWRRMRLEGYSGGCVCVCVCVCVWFWSENGQGWNQSQDLGIYERIILEWILGKQSGRLWTGFMWGRIGANGELLW